MCRKLETEEEKILPFYASSLTPQEENEVKQAMLESPSQELADVCAKRSSLSICSASNSMFFFTFCCCMIKIIYGKS